MPEYDDEIQPIGHRWEPEDFFQAAPPPEPCRDCGGRGWTDYNREDGGSCPRCGGAGCEGGYAALRDSRP